MIAIKYWKHYGTVCDKCGRDLAIIGTQDNWPPACLNAACVFYVFEPGEPTPVFQLGEPPTKWWPK